ncbi:MAG: hypothetical protein ACYDC2_13885 [Solirubrobacteraceae bacterium]
MKYPMALAALLAALAAATYVAWPAMRGTTDRTRSERARQDAQAIAGALISFYRDNGFFPLWARQPDGKEGQLRRIDLLVSDGEAPSAPPGSLWATGRIGMLASELVTNRPSYGLREDPDGMGWNGPYLPESPGPDPWGRRYAVNIGLIPSADSPPDDRGPARFAVWVLSSGPDGIVETSYRQPIGNAALAGDDIGVRLQ